MLGGHPHILTPHMLRPPAHTPGDPSHPTNPNPNPNANPHLGPTPEEKRALQTEVEMERAIMRDTTPHHAGGSVFDELD